MKTVTRNDLVDAVVEDTGIARKDAAAAVEGVLVRIADAMTQGNTAELRGFGTFKPRVDCGRVVRDPKNPAKGSFRMPPRITVKFSASSVLVAALNEEQPS